MKASLTLLGVILVSTVVVAQDYNKGLKKELEEIDEMYPAKKSSKVEVTKVKAQEVQTAEVQAPVSYGPQLPEEAKQQQSVQQPTTQNIQQQPVYIIQQPTTNVEANQLKESRAEQIRKQREEMEHQNEMKLIEKLEEERMNSEKERADKIMAPITAKPEAAVVVPAASQTATVVPAQPEVVPAGTQTQKPKEIDNALAAAVVINKIEENRKNEYLINLMGGAGNYPSVGNVSGAYAFGGSFEVRFPNRIGIESSVAYSSYDVRNANTCPYCIPGTPLLTTMNQWDVSGGFNYAIFKSTLTPLVGVMLDYARRDYSSRVTYGTGNPSFTGSNAFNGGFQAGFEVRASDNLVLGGSLRYMMNISYRTDNPLAYYNGYVYNVGTPIESLSYYMAMLTTKLTF